MVQLVERWLSTPENRGSNPVTCIIFYYQMYSKDENKEKEAGKAQFLRRDKLFLDNICLFSLIIFTPLKPQFKFL